jgi:uncharacterized membrane protein YedE/YeeE
MRGHFAVRSANVPGEYLNWWMAGLALGGLACAQWLIERRPVGVSGFVHRSLQLLLRPAIAREESRVLHADPAALRAALLEATEEERGSDSAPTPARRTETPAASGTTLRNVVTGRGALFFVIAMVFGSAIATVQRGSWAVTTTLGPSFEALWGDGAVAALALLLGGVIVGIGTRMAGGCTSGHGLSGCSRLQIGSLVSTATFMASAVAMTFLLRGFR